MTFRTLKYIAPAFATILLAGIAAAPANATPLQKAVFDDAAAQSHVTLVDNRDRHWRGDRDRGRDRHWRGRDHDRRHYRAHNYYRPYYPPPRPPRYVYVPPAYYSPYEPYYPYSGYFSYSSPSLGFSFGY